MTKIMQLWIGFVLSGTVRSIPLSYLLFTDRADGEAVLKGWVGIAEPGDYEIWGTNYLVSEEGVLFTESFIFRGFEYKRVQVVKQGEDLIVQEI